MDIIWTRKSTPGSAAVEFHAIGSRVVVRKIDWAKPGGSTGQRSHGWAIFVDGVQYGAAHGWAREAKAHAEQPGVWRSIQQIMADNDRKAAQPRAAAIMDGSDDPDGEDEEILRDLIVKAAMDWHAGGCNLGQADLDPIEDAARSLKAWELAHPSK